MKQTQNQFYGRIIDLPSKLPPGSIYVCSDHNVVFISKADGKPIKICDENSESSGFSSVKKIVTQENFYDISESDDNSLISMEGSEDWGVILPESRFVSDNFSVIVSHQGSSRNKGGIVPYGEEKINGFDSFELYGSGFVNIQKSQGSWIVASKSLFLNRRGEGETNVYDFNNESIIDIQHNFGYIPIVQVWHKFGEGENDYTLSNAEVLHDWQNMLSFQVILNEINSGKITYI
tara:strand:- start:310 stop:1011 length:702 start_codon:yes stop_codon:yes gene_type:complete